MSSKEEEEEREDDDEDEEEFSVRPISLSTKEEPKTSGSGYQRVVAVTCGDWILINPNNISIEDFMKDYPALREIGLTCHVFVRSVGEIQRAIDSLDYCNAGGVADVDMCYDTDGYLLAHVWRFDAEGG